MRINHLHVTFLAGDSKSSYLVSNLSLWTNRSFSTNITILAFVTLYVHTYTQGENIHASVLIADSYYNNYYRANRRWDSCEIYIQRSLDR